MGSVSQSAISSGFYFLLTINSIFKYNYCQLRYEATHWKYRTEENIITICVKFEQESYKKTVAIRSVTMYKQSCYKSQEKCRSSLKLATI